MRIFYFRGTNDFEKKVIFKGYLKDQEGNMRPQPGLLIILLIGSVVSMASIIFSISFNNVKKAAVTATPVPGPPLKDLTDENSEFTFSIPCNTKKYLIDDYSFSGAGTGKHRFLLKHFTISFHQQFYH
jgi:hypothetical protein